MYNPIYVLKCKASCADCVVQNPRLDHIIHGLGCEGVELTKMYWTLLRKQNLVRTAEDEEQRRFTAAPPTDVPQTTFAASVYRLIRACVRACPQTNGMAITFVKAGTLHLHLFFSEAERLFRIHERWLTPDGALTELGLPEDLTEADMIFHAVKRLFAEALEQLPRSAFLEEGDGREAEWRRKLEISLAEQRLLNYFRTWGEVNTDLFRTVPTWMVKWNAAAQMNRQNVEVQCHRASRCSYLRDSLLIADDGKPPQPCRVASFSFQLSQAPLTYFRQVVRTECIVLPRVVDTCQINKRYRMK